MIVELTWSGLVAFFEKWRILPEGFAFWLQWDITSRRVFLTFPIRWRDSQRHLLVASYHSKVIPGRFHFIFLRYLILCRRSKCPAVTWRNRLSWVHSRNPGFILRISRLVETRILVLALILENKRVTRHCPSPWRDIISIKSLKNPITESEEVTNHDVECHQSQSFRSTLLNDPSSCEFKKPSYFCISCDRKRNETKWKNPYILCPIVAVWYIVFSILRYKHHKYVYIYIYSLTQQKFRH